MLNNFFLTKFKSKCIKRNSKKFVQRLFSTDKEKMKHNSTIDPYDLDLSDSIKSQLSESNKKQKRSSKLKMHRLLYFASFTVILLIASL